MNRIAFLLILLFTAVSIHPFEWGNWRSSYCGYASGLDLLESSSSGLFWDDMRGSSVFDQGIWPDSQWLYRNHWHAEPALRADASNRDYIDGRNAFAHGGLTNDIRFMNLFIRHRLDVDTRYKYDPSFVWKNDRILAGRFEEAYLQGTWKYGFFRLGRTARNWGPFFDRSLVLSSNPRTYDAFEWGVSGSFFEFRHLFAPFDYSRSGMDTDSGYRINRYFAAHALNFMFGEWASVGVTESILFGRQNGFPDFQYVNPFSLYTVLNTNQEGNGNLMLGFQGKAHPFTRKILVKGQVVIDDIQVDDPALPENQEPTHWGCDWGAYWQTPISIQNFVTLEYTYLSKWLYLVPGNNANAGERYTLLGQSLGNEQNDADRWHLAFSAIGKKYWAGTAGLRYQRRGGNTVASSWNTTAGWNGYTRETSLRSDSCEHTIEPYLQGLFYFKGYADISVGFSSRWIKNKGNIKSASFIYEPALSLSLSMQYPRFYLPFPEHK